MRHYFPNQFRKYYQIFYFFHFFLISTLNAELISLMKHGPNISLHEEDCEKILEKITECLLSKSNAEENFNLFCQYKLIEKIISLTKYNIKNINIIIIKNLGLLIPSIKYKKILYYFFSHDYINQIILNISASIEEQDIDFLSYYINFLKTIANKLDVNTLSQLFHKENNSFPLLDEASSFFNFNDVMIKNTARNIFLTIIKLNYEPVIQYICDIPRITDLLLLNDNIKSYIIYMTTININNINNNNFNDIELKLKEVEESLVDDILFIQDILSVALAKINYILINCLFSIPLQFLFNCILKHDKINIAFYILNLILKNIKNECVNNLIFFTLYSSQINQKINEFFKKQENQEICNILYLNKFISHHSGCLNLVFDEYLILVYNQNFLKSLRYIKKEEKVFEEIQEMANLIKENSDETVKDINAAIKILSEKLDKNNRLAQIIKKMESYHNLISRYTGINLGISRHETNFSFLKMINDNLLFYNNNENNLKNSININIQENIIKKEILDLINCDEENQYNYINQIFFILQIINSNKISSELKKFLCINKNIIETNEQNSCLDEPNEQGININNILENKLIFRNLRIKNGIDDIESDSSIPGKKRNDIIKDFFGISETKTDYDMLNNYFTNSLYEENNINNNQNINLIPKPVNNEVNDEMINYKNFHFNNKHMNKLLVKLNAKNLEENNYLNLQFHDDLLHKVIEALFNTNKIFSKIIYRLSLELIENLIFGVDINKIFIYRDKYKNIFIKKFTQILNDINGILLKSNSTKTKIYKFAYQYFEDCFIVNKKNSNLILNECISKYYTYFLLNIKNKKSPPNFNIIDIPNNEHENLQCLFQALIGLCDLKKLLGIDNNKINETNIQKNLLRNIEFPLRLIKTEYNVGNIINIKNLNPNVNPVPVMYKSKDIEFPNFFIFNYHNYLFVVSSLDKKEEIKKFFLIKYKLPLRQILAYPERGEPRTLILLNQNEIEATLFFEGVQEATYMKDNINNAIKLANLKEFSEVKKFINDLMKN